MEGMEGMEGIEGMERMAGKEPPPAPLAGSLYAALAGHCRLRRRRQGGDGSLVLLAEAAFPADFPGFAGHFPGRPVLPAVVQLALVRHLAEEALGLPLWPESCSRIKFKGMVRPAEALCLRLELTAAEGGGWQAVFALQRPEGEMVASGGIRFTAAGR